MRFNKTLLTCCSKDLNKGLMPMLIGEPGIGKTSWVCALAEEMHTKCFVLSCNLLADKADLTGARLIPVLNEEGQTVGYKQEFYPHAVIYDAIAYANEHKRETPILFLDEINRTTPDVTSSLLSVATTRTIGFNKLPENLRVIVAGNDKGHVTALDDASISRFILYRVEPDVHTFKAVNPDLNPFVENVLKAHPECLFCKPTGAFAAMRSDDKDDKDDDNDNTIIEEILDDDDSMSQFTTPRTITAVSEWLNGFTNAELQALINETYVVDNRERSVLEELIEGHVGSTNFAVYLLAEIMQNVVSVNNQQAVFSVGKPAVYDAMKLHQDMTSLQNLISSMSIEDKAGCLVYAIHEKADNSNHIRALAQYTDSLPKTDVQVFTKMLTSSNFDQDNLQAFLDTKTTLATSLEPLIVNFL